MEDDENDGMGKVGSSVSPCPRYSPFSSFSSSLSISSSLDRGETLLQNIYQFETRILLTINSMATSLFGERKRKRERIMINDLW